MNGRVSHYILMAVACTLNLTVGWARNVALVREGAPVATVVVAKDATGQVSSAAKMLVQYVEQASGAKLSIVTDDAHAMVPKGAAIFVGKTSVPAGKVALPKGLDDDGFVVQVKGDTVAILGPTDYGTEFGVYFFLEKFVGVRWLLPGPDGTDVPQAKTIEVPEGTSQDQPAFMSRLFSGLRGGAQVQWAKFNRMHGRISFHHNLIRLFPPETYTKSHPEFFPMKDGKTRFLPETNSTHGWQPCFTAPSLVEEAIKNIVQYFEEHPQETSYSLGTNDSSGYCRCPECLARISGEKNFLGLTDYSDLYYDWCNKVIEEVLKVYPDKWFGCLAYSEVAAPPKKVKVHSRLIPYMTYDRMKWIHPEVRAAGQAATEAWAKTSPTLGWYDYIYGSPYCLPRVFFHQSADYLRYGQQHGVKAHYAEIYPNWGEGPKPYIFLRLWWNPGQNVDALLKEWYERCVGPDAAPDLAKYYGIWERFWTKDILNSKWFSVGGQYLAFYSPTYLTDVKEADVLESRRLLDSCIAKCRTPKQKARAMLLEKAFQYYESSALAYLADSKKGTVAINTEADALSALKQSERALSMAQKRRALALDDFPKDPVLVHPITVQDNAALAGENWGGSGLWAVMDWVNKGGAIKSKVEELAQKSDSPLVRSQAATMLAIAAGKIQPVTLNSSFEDGTGPASAQWGYWVKPDATIDANKPVGKMLRVEDFSHTGKASLLCDGMYRGGPLQAVKFPGPGKYCALAWVYVPKEGECKGTAELTITPLDDKGQNLPGFSTKILPPAGVWTLIVAAGDIGAKAGEKEVMNLRVIPVVDSVQNCKVYWDDVALYRVEEK